MARGIAQSLMWVAFCAVCVGTTLLVGTSMQGVAIGPLVVQGFLAGSVGLCVGLPDQPFVRQRMRAALAASLAAAGLFAAVQWSAAAAWLRAEVLVALVPALWVAEVVVSTIAVALVTARPDRVLLIGSMVDADRTARDKAQHTEIACTLVAHVVPGDTSRLAELAAMVRSEAVTLVVVADDAIELPEVSAALTAVHLGGTRVHTLTQFYLQWLGKVPIRHMPAAAVLFDAREVHHVGYRRLSRVLDVVSALIGVGLLAVAIPIVAVANLFGNRGPLFFSQPRVGRNGQVFNIYKFRTMLPGPANGEWTSPDDPRITPFGRVMRRWHLDELPQVMNVLRGELSIVGPRPEQPQYVERLTRQIPYYPARFLARPGLTGWAQVNYPYGADEADAFEKLQFELWYLGNQSIWLDLRIINRTLRHVLGLRARPVRHRGEVDLCASPTS